MSSRDMSYIFLIQTPKYYFHSAVHLKLSHIWNPWELNDVSAKICSMLLSHQDNFQCVINAFHFTRLSCLALGVTHSHNPSIPEGMTRSMIKYD